MVNERFEGAAADVEVQDGSGAPAVPAPDRKERHGRFLAAGEFLERHRGFVLDPGQHGRPVGGFADGRSTKGQQVLGFVLGSELPRFQDEFDELVLAGVVDVSLGVEELHERQRAFVRGKGHRPSAGMRINQEQVDGV